MTMDGTGDSRTTTPGAERNGAWALPNRSGRSVRRILVTGGTGFVGRRLVAALAAQGDTVRLAVRRPLVPGMLPADMDAMTVGEIGPDTVWDDALDGVDAVVHAAARVHQRTAAGTVADREAHWRINAEGTGALVRACARHGIRRVVFLSTVKVLGESSGAVALSDGAAPAPADAYAASKHAGECAALAAAGPALTVTVLRPPLVYGPGVGGNFRTLLRVCAAPVPLPFGAVANRRSLIFVGNLVDAVLRALDVAAPAAGAFLVCDGEALSTAALIRRLRHAMGRPAALLPVPPAWLATAAGLTGRKAVLGRLTGDLAVDDSRFRTLFGWRPPIDLMAGLAETVAWFRGEVVSGKIPAGPAV